MAWRSPVGCTPNAKNHTSFVTWCERERVLFPKCRIAVTENTGRCVSTSKFIAEGEVVVELPDDVVLMVENCRIAEELAGWGLSKGTAEDDIFEVQGLIIAVMYEKHRHKKSRWGPYLQFLPDDMTHMLPYWKAAELHELKGTTAYDKLKGHVQHPADAPTQVRTLWRDVVSPFIAGCPALQLPTGQKGFELYCWATCAVASYSFILGDDKYQAMVPVWDLLNHITGASNVRLHHDPKRRVLQMIATQAISAGAEVVNNYGPLSTSELLRGYGFVEKGNNVHDHAQVPLCLVLKACRQARQVVDGFQPKDQLRLQPGLHPSAGIKEKMQARGKAETEEDIGDAASEEDEESDEDEESEEEEDEDEEEEENEDQKKERGGKEAGAVGGVTDRVGTRAMHKEAEAAPRCQCGSVLPDSKRKQSGEDALQARSKRANKQSPNGVQVPSQIAAHSSALVVTGDGDTGYVEECEEDGKDDDQHDENQEEAEQGMEKEVIGSILVNGTAVPQSPRLASLSAPAKQTFGRRVAFCRYHGLIPTNEVFKLHEGQPPPAELMEVLRIMMLDEEAFQAFKGTVKLWRAPRARPLANCTAACVESVDLMGVMVKLVHLMLGRYAHSLEHDKQLLRKLEALPSRLQAAVVARLGEKTALLACQEWVCANGSQGCISALQELWRHPEIRRHPDDEDGESLDEESRQESGQESDRCDNSEHHHHHGGCKYGRHGHKHAGGQHGDHAHTGCKNADHEHAECKHGGCKHAAHAHGKGVSECGRGKSCGPVPSGFDRAHHHDSSEHGTQGMGSKLERAAGKQGQSHQAQGCSPTSTSAAGSHEIRRRRVPPCGCADGATKKSNGGHAATGVQIGARAAVKNQGGQPFCFNFSI